MYCTRCGKQNDDDATFCKHCGAPLMAPPPQAAPGQDWQHRGRRVDNECDRECQSGGRSHSWIWGVIIILVGLWIILNWALPNIDFPGMPSWVRDFNFWWIVPLVLGILVIVLGVRLMTRGGQAK